MDFPTVFQAFGKQADTVEGRPKGVPPADQIAESKGANFSVPWSASIGFDGLVEVSLL